MLIMNFNQFDVCDRGNAVTGHRWPASSTRRRANHRYPVCPADQDRDRTSWWRLQVTMSDRCWQPWDAATATRWKDDPYRQHRPVWCICRCVDKRRPSSASNTATWAKVDSGSLMSDSVSFHIIIVQFIQLLIMKNRN